jgi:Cellulase (glycosyl hydrolase family 5)
VCCALGVVAVIAPVASAEDTSGFRGVNWADPRDNYAADAVVPSGLSISDSYATTFNVMWQRLTSKYAGDNAVHFEPMNEPFGYTSQQWTDIVRHLPRAATDRLRQLHMGSVYWPGLRTR